MVSGVPGQMPELGFLPFSSGKLWRLIVKYWTGLIAKSAGESSSEPSQEYFVTSGNVATSSAEGQVLSRDSMRAIKDGVIKGEWQLTALLSQEFCRSIQHIPTPETENSPGCAVIFLGFAS